jgi:plastocyanin
LRVRTLMLLGAVALVTSTAGCGGAAPPFASSGTSAGAGDVAVASTGTTTSKVQATDKLKFVPQTLSVNVGAIVEWDNTGIAPHNITFDPPNSSLTKTTFNAGDKWQMKFTSAGTYAYTCTIHPGMVGTITVAPARS